jgi:hypothetical protein
MPHPSFARFVVIIALSKGTVNMRGALDFGSLRAEKGFPIVINRPNLHGFIHF